MTLRPTPFRVLVVDDDADLRDALADYFGQKGLSVVSAPDGEEAIRMIEASAEPFQIVLADLVMPHKTGLEVLKAAKEKFPDAHVVIVTGYASLESAVEAVRLGAYDYILKPFRMDEMEVLLKHVGERIGLLHENRDLVNNLRDLHDRLDALNETKCRTERTVREMGHALADNTQKLGQVLAELHALKEEIKGGHGVTRASARTAAATRKAPKRRGTRPARRASRMS
ncbi:MAG: response regulator [Acidobacteriota bacterium]